jgi:hypothetical protein
MGAFYGGPKKNIFSKTAQKILIKFQPFMHITPLNKCGSGVSSEK